MTNKVAPSRGQAIRYDMILTGKNSARYERNIDLFLRARVS